MSRRGGWRAGALLLAGLAAACGRDPPLPPLVRLWRELPPVAVATPQPPPAVETSLGRARLSEGGAPFTWKLVTPREGEDRLDISAFEPPAGPLVLRRAEAWAAGFSLPVQPGQALAVRVTARAEGEFTGEAVPLVAVVELKQPFGSEGSMPMQEAARLFDPARSASHVIEAPLRRQAVTAQTDFVVQRSTTFLAVFLLAPLTALPRGVVFDEVEVVRVPVTARVAAGGDFPRLERLEGPGVVRIALDRDLREGLLALPGRAWTWRLPADERARSLDLAFGVAPRFGEAQGTLRFVVEQDGRALRELRMEAPDGPDVAAWRDERVPLERTAGPTELTLRVVGEGEDPPVGFIGHPSLRTSDPRAPSRPSIVLISLDTLRPDRLGCYGGDGGLSPRLDALAAAGLRFDAASSTSSYTLPSHASMMTGQFPAFHGAVNITDRLDPQRSPFLAAELARAGWVTAAFTGGGYVSTDYGFFEGFDRYAHNDPVWALQGVRGRQLLDTVNWELAPALVPLLRRYAAPAVVEWIEAQAGGPPFFLFLHTYIVHNYAPDRARLEAHGLLDARGEESSFDHRDRVAVNEQGRLDLVGKVREQYLPYYDATIEMADEFVGQVLDALARAGLDDDTIVVVTSDHGEEFGEHGFFGHGETLHEDATRVPLIVRLPPGVRGTETQPAVLEEPVSLVDIAPWLLRLSGLVPPPRMSITPPLGPERDFPPGRQRLFIELDTTLSRVSAVRHGALKLHAAFDRPARGLEPGVPRLYDLASDPREAVDLAEARADETRALLGLIEGFHALAESIHPRGPAGPVDLSTLPPDVIDTLRALGYIGADDLK